MNVIKAAIEAALQSSDKIMVGAVVHQKSKIFSTGFNCGTKTHPDAQQHEGFNVHIHAEHAALLKIRWHEYSNLEVTVVRILRENGNLAIAKPCDNCMRIMDDFGVKKIHYTSDDGRLITLERNIRTVPEKIAIFAKEKWKEMM